MNTKKHLISNVIAIAIASALFIPAALAGGHKSSAHKANKRANPAELLSKFDRNNDGALDRHELATMRAYKKQLKKKKRMRKRFDKNKDGRLNKKEKHALERHRVNKRYTKLLAAHDFDRDGALSWAEIASSKKRSKMRSRKRSKGPRANAVSGHERARNIGKKSGKKLRKLFRRADRNGDGVLTRAEFRAAAMARRSWT